MFNKEFYKAYPNLKDCSLQVFNENWTWWAEILEYSRDNLVKIHSYWEQGKWCFFSVNSMIKWKRDKKSVTNINAWICEVDDTSKQEQMDKIMNCPLYPSMIIESKKSYHMYWFCEEWVTEDQRIQWNKGLCEYFWWDTKIIKDTSRVLRLPWFKHVKDPEDPFDVNCIFYKNETHSFKDLSDKFEYTWIYDKKETPVRVWSSHNDTWGKEWDSSIVRFGKTREAREMLQQLSGTRMIWWDDISFRKNSNWTEQILCNWKSTSCWIDWKGMIWSTDWWWPTWVNRARRHQNLTTDEVEDYIYNHLKNRLDEKQISWYEKKRWITRTPQEKKENKKKVIEQKIKETEDIRDTEDVVIDHWPKVSITWWLDSLDDELKRLTLQDLVIFVAYPQMWKSLFCLLMAQANWLRWYRSTFFSLELSKRVFFERTWVESAGLDWNEYLDWDYSDQIKWKIDLKVNELNNMVNVDVVWSNESVDLETLLAWIRKFHSMGTELFFIDNLWKIVWEWNESENSRFERITSELQNIMKELDICIVLMHHLSKPMKWDEYKPWWWSAFRGTQKIKDNCTCMVEIRYNRDKEADIEVRNFVNLIQYKRTRAWWADRMWTFMFQRWVYVEENDFNWSLTRKWYNDSEEVF